MYPYKNIPGNKVLGKWENSQYGVFTFNENGTGEFVNRTGNRSKPITYINEGSFLLVSVEGENTQRKFYLRMNDHSLYELITEDNRWKSRRNDYRKIPPL